MELLPLGTVRFDQPQVGHVSFAGGELMTSSRTGCRMTSIPDGSNQEEDLPCDVQTTAIPRASGSSPPR